MNNHELTSKIVDMLDELGNNHRANKYVGKIIDVLSNSINEHTSHFNDLIKSKKWSEVSLQESYINGLKDALSIINHVKEEI